MSDASRIEFIENAARKNAEFHVSTAEYLAKEAHQTLLLLISGAAGAVAYAVSMFEKELIWAAWGMMAAGAYLFALSSLLVFKCLRIRPIWPVSNEPDAFMSEDAAKCSLHELREGEIKSQQRCIRRNRERNDEVGHWLTNVRLLSPGVMLVFTLVALVTYCWVVRLSVTAVGQAVQ